MPRGFRTASLALLVGGAAACFSDRPPTAPEPPAGGQAVAIRNFAYAPPALSVASGSTVTWTNRDSEAHTVTADDGSSFDSNLLANGQSFQLTIPAPGAYPYHCSVHPFMTGTLTVTAP